MLANQRLRNQPLLHVESSPSVLWCLWNENKMSARRLWLSYVLRGACLYLYPIDWLIDCALPVLWSSFKFALMSRETKTFLVIIFVALCVLSQNFAGKETLIAFSRVSTVRKLDRSVISQGLTMRFLVVNLLLISLFRSHNVTRMWFSLSIS